MPNKYKVLNSIPSTKKVKEETAYSSKVNRTEQNRTGQDRRTSRKIPGLGNNEKDNINITDKCNTPYQHKSVQ